MKKIHCNGCGMTEEINSPRGTIKTVFFSITEDTRSWSAKPEFEADLCSHCYTRLLHNYFGVSLKDDLDEPIIVKSVTMPQSLRVAN